jgi:hypothetical protein
MLRHARFSSERKLAYLRALKVLFVAVEYIRGLPFLRSLVTVTIKWLFTFGFLPFCYSFIKT